MLLCIVLVKDTLRQQQRRVALRATLHNNFNRKVSHSSLLLQLLVTKIFNKPREMKTERAMSRKESRTGKEATL